MVLVLNSAAVALAGSVLMLWLYWWYGCSAFPYFLFPAGILLLGQPRSSFQSIDRRREQQIAASMNKLYSTASNEWLHAHARLEHSCCSVCGSAYRSRHVCGPARLLGRALHMGPSQCGTGLVKCLFGSCQTHGRQVCTILTSW